MISIYYIVISQRTNIRSVSSSIVNCRPPSPTSRGFPTTTIETPKPSPQLMKPAPPDLASVLVEIRNPEDIEQCVLAKTFRDYLEETEEEGLLDFVIVCNILRNKESDVKVLRQKTEDLSDVVYIPSKDAVLNKERRDMMQMLGDTFINDDCFIPIQLKNQTLMPQLREAMDKISNLRADGDDEKQSDYLSTVFSLVWQARCDFNVYKKLEANYKKFLSCRYANGR